MADTFNKRFNSGDVFTIPYEANKQWDITASLFPEYNIFSETGINPTSSYIQEYTRENLVYKSVLANFYPEFYPTLSLATSSYYQTNNFTSSLTSTDYAVSGALRLGNPYSTIKNYPTEPNSEVFILNVPTSVYSNRILPTTVEIDLEGGFKVYDDGEYNLLWSGSSVSSSVGTIISQSMQIGNVFYEQGLITFTTIPIIPATFIPMINTINVTNETCAAANNGVIQVITIQGSGDFSYELVGFTPPQPANIFTGLNQGSYIVRIYDNQSGDINDLGAVVGNDNTTTTYAVSLQDISSNTVIDDQYYKWVEKSYEVLISPPLPTGTSATIIIDAYTDFSTNFRSPGTYRARTQTPSAPLTNAVPLAVTKNGTNQVISLVTTSGTTPAMTCDPTNTFQKLQSTYRTSFVMNAGDTVVVSNRNIISVQTPSPDPLCLTEAFNKITNTITTATLTVPCSVRILTDNTKYNDLYIN